jgi:splicing factor 3B subunit 3
LQQPGDIEEWVPLRSRRLWKPVIPDSFSTFWKFTNLGEKDADPIIASSADDEANELVFFPRTPEILKLVDEWQSLSVISDMLIEDLVGEGNPQIYCLCAAGSRSTLRVLRHGLSITEVANAPLKRPLAIWSLKERNGDKFDKFIILSFQKTTIVLLTNGEKISELKESPLELKKSSILVALLQDDSMIQVVSTGIKHVKLDGKVNQWQSDNGTITNAVCNQKQLVISIHGGDIIYFELDSEGNLSEMEKITPDSAVTHF